jgi:hypothetical protein
MTKLVALLHGGPTDRAARRQLLLDTLSPRLLALGLDGLIITVADEAADVPGPNPFPVRDAPVAVVNLYGGTTAHVELLRDAGFRVHAWQVDETIPTTWGDTPHAGPHAGPRDWPDGARSPGVTAVSLIRRRPDLDDAAFLAAWHGRMSPVSARIQPRIRYVRNHLRTALTPDAPDWAAIVEEAWPTPRHVTNPMLFYGASNPLQLVRHAVEILAAVNAITRPWQVVTFMASEWCLKTPPTG